MSIKVGDKVPNINFTTMTADGIHPVGYDDLFAGKRVALFSVPGAFTLCSLQHLPGFIQKASELTAKGLTQLHAWLSMMYL